MLSLLFALAVLGSALAKIVPTAPIQSTVWDARKAQTLEWIDDGKAPPLNLTGRVYISLWTGGIQQQTFLASLSGSRFVNPTRLNTTVQFPQDAGPNGQYYFLRFDAPDSMSTSIFSGRFALTHMAGSFNSTVWAQLKTLDADTSASASSSLRATTSLAPSSASSAASSATSSPASSSDALPLPLSNLLVGGAALLALAWSL